MTESQTTDRQHQVMAEAFQGLLNGDTTKRDRLMQDMEQARLLDAKEQALQKLKDVDFLVRADGVAIASRDVLKVAL